MNRRIRIIVVAVVLAMLIIGLGLALNKSGDKQDAGASNAGTEAVSPAGTDTDQNEVTEPAGSEPAAEPAGTQETDPAAEPAEDDNGTDASGSEGSGGSGNSNAQKPGSSSGNADAQKQEGTGESSIAPDALDGSMPINELETIEIESPEVVDQTPAESGGSEEQVENETSMMTDF